MPMTLILRMGASCYDLDLVSIMMKNSAAFFDIFVAKCPAYRFCKSVSHAVGVSHTFSFNYFNLLFFDRCLCDFFNADVSCHSFTSKGFLQMMHFVYNLSLIHI